MKILFKLKVLSCAFHSDLIRNTLHGNTIIVFQSLFELSLLFIADVLVRSNEEALTRNLGAIICYEAMFLEFDNQICWQNLINDSLFIYKLETHFELSSFIVTVEKKKVSIS